MYVKASGFLPRFFLGHKEGVCMPEEKEVGCCRVGGEATLLPASPKHSNGFVQSIFALEEGENAG